jgi:BirA family transcriptional regulator, biotin operon repressor / biotin---[acetyl-CoA-carboxylase] ligase
MRALLKSSDLSTKEIKARIKGTIGKEIFFYSTVSSTNTIATELAEKTVEGAVVLADSQERGRGKFGRLWVSPPGVNIYMSIITKPEIDSKNGTLITLMSAVACATALRKSTGLPVTLKWPNDLMVNDKKIGGILTEVKTEHQKITFAIIGMGINVNMETDAFPEEIRKIATSIKIQTGVPHPRTEIISEILNEMDNWYKFLKKLCKTKILSEWRRLTSTLGREVTVIIGKETFSGLAESIDDDGILILRFPSGKKKKIYSGDLNIIR